MVIFKCGIWPSILIIILMILGLTAAALGRWQFNNQIDAELEDLKEENLKISDKQIIRNEELNQLPSPVKKWLKKVGVAEKNKIKGFL